MILLEIFNTEKVAAGLRAVPAKVEAAAATSLGRWAAELAAYIKETKLNGEPLHRRSGALSATVHPVATTLPGRVSAGAGGGAGVPYALIHELGGIIPAHKVVVKDALALSIKLPGGTIYRHSANIPEVVMPERSYMRSALTDMAPEGIKQLKAAVMEAALS